MEPFLTSLPQAAIQHTFLLNTIPQAKDTGMAFPSRNLQSSKKEKNVVSKSYSIRFLHSKLIIIQTKVAHKKGNSLFPELTGMFPE